jgi:hypothetical protein
VSYDHATKDPPDKPGMTRRGSGVSYDHASKDPQDKPGDDKKREWRVV